MARARALLWLVAAGVLAGTGCAKTLGASTTQPNPLALPSTEVLRESQHLHIEVRDMEIPRTFRLRNSAYFAVISKDRLRFHVTLVHKWDEMTDVANWDVYLVDDRGRVFRPERKERRRQRFRTTMWDYEQRTARYSHFGDVVGTRNDGHRRRTHLASVDVYQGEGDYVFYARDIFGPRVKRLTLVMRHGSLEYRFTWNFTDPS